MIINQNTNIKEQIYEITFNNITSNKKNNYCAYIYLKAINFLQQENEPSYIKIEILSDDLEPLYYYYDLKDNFFDKSGINSNEELNLYLNENLSLEPHGFSILVDSKKNTHNIKIKIYYCGNFLYYVDDNNNFFINTFFYEIKNNSTKILMSNKNNDIDLLATGYHYEILNSDNENETELKGTNTYETLTLYQIRDSTGGIIDSKRADYWDMTGNALGLYANDCSDSADIEAQNFTYDRTYTAIVKAHNI